MLNRLTYRQAGTVDFPEGFQVDGIGREDGDVIAAGCQVAAEPGKVGLRASQSRWIALHEMSYAHLDPSVRYLLRALTLPARQQAASLPMPSLHRMAAIIDESAAERGERFHWMQRI